MTGTWDGAKVMVFDKETGFTEVPTKDGLGWWFAPCCIHDLRPVRTEEQLAEERRFEREIGGRWWKTLQEAIDELSKEDWDEFEIGIAYGLANASDEDVSVDWPALRKRAAHNTEGAQ